MEDKDELRIKTKQKLNHSNVDLMNYKRLLLTIKVITANQLGC